MKTASSILKSKLASNNIVLNHMYERFHEYFIDIFTSRKKYDNNHRS